jgi:acetoin utilization protein AcuB
MPRTVLDEPARARTPAGVPRAYQGDLEEPSVDLYMTPSPRTIQADQSLSTTHQLMRTHAIRHLPVLDGEELVGIVSLRDLYLFETLDDIDLNAVAVREAMIEEVYSVAPATPLAEVARTMAEHKYGSAIVIDRGTVIGIFTAVDGLRALSLLISQVERANH